MIASKLIASFGGSNKTARILGFSESTVSKWKSLYDDIVPLGSARTIVAEHKGRFSLISKEEAEMFAERPKDHPYNRSLDMEQIISEILSADEPDKAANA